MAGEAGGTFSVVSLLNAKREAAETLRGVLTGEAPAGWRRDRAGTSRRPASAPVSGRAGGSMILAEAGDLLARHHAPDVTYNANCARGDRQLDARRAQVSSRRWWEITARKRRVRHPVAGPCAQSRRAARIFRRHHLGGRNNRQQLSSTPRSTTALWGRSHQRIVSGTITIPASRVTNLGGLARAWNRNANANILSTPNLLTMDNEGRKRDRPECALHHMPVCAARLHTTRARSRTSTPRRRLTLTCGRRFGGARSSCKWYQEISILAPDHHAPNIITDMRSIDSTVLWSTRPHHRHRRLIQDTMQDGVDGCRWRGTSR